MIKKALLFGGALVVMTIMALVFITARSLDKEELARVQSEMESLSSDKAQLENKVSELDNLKDKLYQTIDKKNKEIIQHQLTINNLEDERKNQQVEVRHLNTEEALENSFSKAFPQVIKAKNFGITNIAINEDKTLTLPYYVIPAWFTETFIIEHNNMIKFKEEIEEYKKNEALYGNVIELKDNVLKLESEKSQAYEKGYDEAFLKYQALNQEYIALLKKPPVVEIKAPSLWPILGAAFLGLTLGAGI
jgi:type II secretory pathway component PulM